MRKSDNDIPMYTRLTSRPLPNLTDGSYDDSVKYGEIIEYLKNNRRKGNR